MGLLEALDFRSIIGTLALFDGDLDFVAPEVELGRIFSKFCPLEIKVFVSGELKF